MIYKTLFILVLITISFSSAGMKLGVGITENLQSISIIHNDRKVIVRRNQNVNNLINPEFAKTSRPCPPFCIKPITIAEGVETVIELNVLDYLQDDNSVIIDSRTVAWVSKGSIPGAINLPWDIFNNTQSDVFKKLLEVQFNVTVNEDKYYFDAAKTLVLFCNGPWCNQSPTSIKALLQLGYPPEKLKWYRGGMQSWESLGLTTVDDVLIPQIDLDTKIIDLLTLPSEETTIRAWMKWFKNFFFVWQDSEPEVNITLDLKSVPVNHNGQEMLIKRIQNKNNTINPEFAKTSRPCPPKCLRPIDFMEKVEIVAELEILNYLERMSRGDNSILVIDSREIDWVVKGSIPGTVNIPWDVLSGKKSSLPIVRKLLKEQIGVYIDYKGKFFFENAKTLIIFCNGPWCNKSHDNIVSLLEFGYPPEKLKWYRGGMQDWETFGLTTVKDIPMPWFGL
ncbi:rhodanese-like domain-containing protein [Candidatus Halobeggiatoa sp. HSG11]|nr:rhodanese-like domain-containing protein [Candidatus Halobeggiatoa sp. HSG11]